MPIIGVSITKQVAFRDSVQEFSNVYYYNNRHVGAEAPWRYRLILSVCGDG